MGTCSSSKNKDFIHNKNDQPPNDRLAPNGNVTSIMKPTSELQLQQIKTLEEENKKLKEEIARLQQSASHVVPLGDESSDCEESTQYESIRPKNNENVEEKLDDIILYDDIEQEHINTLLKMKLPPQLENPYFLGERKSYKVPNKTSGEREYTNLERDLRRLTLGLKDVDNPEDRKYCKLVILKHYDILCETFKRYCLIGGDTNWLTLKGWQNLYKDLFVIDKNSKVCNEEKIKHLYKMTMDLHDNHKHIKNNESEWNGIWKNDNNENENEDMIFKIKQMSDYKLKGFIKTFDFCDINGVLKNDSKNKTKTLIIFYHKKTDKNIPMKCDVNLVNENKIKIKYETIEESAHKRNNVTSGRFVLNRVDQLSQDDNVAFKAVYGLLRYEFFDMLLKLSQLKFEDATTHNLKYQLFLKLIQDYIIPFICDEASKDGFKWLFKKDKKSLGKLFKMYSRENVDLLNESEWNLLCKNMFSNANIVSDAFKKGGKPTKQDIYQSFQLAKTHLYHLNLTYNEFEKALQNLAHKIYKKKPKSKYIKLNYQDKLKLLLKWAVKLD